jgi:excinuclease UvrABC ATPase subunit
MPRADVSRVPAPAAKKKLNGHAANGAARSKASSSDERIEVFGAREHNLRIDYLEIPKKKLVVFTGVSGSGKSSLAFDTLYAEGQRRYIESLSAYARQFLGQLEHPHVEKLRGLSPTIAIEQKSASGNPRSTALRARGHPALSHLRKARERQERRRDRARSVGPARG